MIKLTFAIIILFMNCISGAFCQKKIKDKNITYQQERMVFKQWDKDKFTPTSGFLGLNPEYWLTWALHPDYPKKDLRPLSGGGPQTQRLAFVAAMQSTENSSKLHADTLRNTAVTEVSNYSGDLSAVDPLWILYYKHQFDALINQDDFKLLIGIPSKEQDYLIQSKTLDWYLEETHSLSERLNGARTTTVDRGSRIMAYHRFLEEYRKLLVIWESKKLKAKLFLSLQDSADKIKNRNTSIGYKSGFQTDRQIAEDIISKMKL